MKVLIAILNILLGVVLLVVNFQPTSFGWENGLGLILGLVLLGGSVGLLRNKKCARWTLPIVPLILVAGMVFSLMNLGAGEGSLTAGPTILAIFILLALCALESLYLFRRPSLAQ